MPDTTSTPAPGMFAEPTAKSGFPTTAVAIATVAVLILAGTLVLLGKKHETTSNTVRPLAAYAQNLVISDVKMSEATSLSGGKSTYIDGNITNTGGATVAGIAVQVFFRNDVAMPPQMESLPLMLVRTHEPYIDTQPVSADPMGPGAKREFRLTFEKIGENWNQQVPEIHVTSVSTR